MFIIQGSHGEAKIFAKHVEDEAIKQIYDIVNHPVAENSQIRIMPDVHAGKGCVIGTTMTIIDKVVPNYVGVDIGCGIHVTKIKTDSLDLDKLDQVIRKFIPAGIHVHETSIVNSDYLYENLKCNVNLNRASLAVGSLGGGNHFIELDKGKDGYYLCIHSGSRYFGKQIADYYQRLAEKNNELKKRQKEALIQRLKAEGRHQEISKELAKLKAPKGCTYLTGPEFDAYINDMKIAQAYAKLNRLTMARIITVKMGWEVLDEFDVIHNYIDTESLIMRKGAISAQKGQKVAIPINMRDGVIIGIGKGNKEWNYSAPHGAGRLMSRAEAKKTISLEDYQKTMERIYSTSVNAATIDEAPMAYKPIKEILSQIHETVEIKEIIKPVYNFKADH